MALTDFPALVPNGEGLNAYPEQPERLRRRMAEVYGVVPEQVLPTRGTTHGLELVLRRARLDGIGAVSGEGAVLERLAAIYGLLVRDGAAVRVVRGADALEVRRLAGEATLVVTDESYAEFADAASLASLTGELENLIVLRSLSFAYGLAGARVGAAVANPRLTSRLEAVLEPCALPTPCVKAAEAALSPSRALAVEARVRLVRGEIERVRAALDGKAEVRSGYGPLLLARPNEAEATQAALLRLGVPARRDGDMFELEASTPEANDRLLAAFGVTVEEASRRRGEVVRDTKETRITATVDLDRTGDVKIDTGVRFFDHMLEQVATHGGFSLRLACDGDVDIDAHHSVEDSALAFGAALKQALGSRAGIGRYGFVAPMDEAEAALSLDLGGRPYAVFDGAFTAERVGDYPTALTPHVFRSLADSLGAAIHVRVTGEDDHHKTEVCFKALGRALRQAVRVEGDVVPSTKGMIA